MILNYPRFHWDIVQGTDEWFDIKAGKLSASTAHDLMINGKGEGGFGSGAITQLARVVEERLTGKRQEGGFSGNWATEWGHTWEPVAREEFELRNFLKVREVGVIEKSSCIVASPDGLVPEIEEGLEIKCFPKNHIGVVETGSWDKKITTQCLFNLWVSGYKKWHLVFFHPNFPDETKYLHYEILPDEEVFKIFEERCKTFNDLVDARVKAIKEEANHG